MTDFRWHEMKPTSPDRLLSAVALLVAAVPFGFGLVRAVRTGSDVRYLWVAAASLIGAMAVVAIGRTFGTRPYGAGVLSVVTFVVATLFGIGAALLLGARAGPGILVVASAFGACFALSSLLHLLGHRRRPE